MLRGIFAFIMLVTLVGCTGQSQTGVNPETPQPIAPSTSVGQVEQTAELPVTGKSTAESAPQEQVMTIQEYPVPADRILMTSLLLRKVGLCGTPPRLQAN